MKISSQHNKCESLEVTIADFGADTFDSIQAEVYLPGSDFTATAEHVFLTDKGDLPLVVSAAAVGLATLSQGVYFLRVTFSGGTLDEQELTAYHLNTCQIDACLQKKRAALTDSSCKCHSRVSEKIMRMEMIKKGVCYNFNNLLFQDVDADIATLVGMCEEDDCNC